MFQANYVLSAYILCSVLHCADLLTPKCRISRFTKPLLMPLLTLYYLLAAKSPDMLVVAALTAGFLGDVFLMMKGKTFILGVSSFFIGHLLYITLFLHSIKLTALHAWLILPAIICVVYGFLIYRCLKPHIGGMITVLIPYMTVLLAMGFFAFVYFVAVGSWRGIPVLAGAIMFIGSDTFLSFDLFVKEKKWRTVAVMATYTLAQGFLVAGLLK